MSVVIQSVAEFDRKIYRGDTEHQENEKLPYNMGLENHLFCHKYGEFHRN